MLILTGNENSEKQNSILLKDGRRLGYKEYGVKDGFPIMGLHGTPGSRIWFSGNDPTSVELGIRLITIDRPGYGLSDEKKDRKIIDFNEDINELIHQLRITRFSIFGVSGGGAYALAFASGGHAQLLKVGMVASAFEFEGGNPPVEMCRPNRIGFYLAKRFPWLLRFNYRQQKKLLYEKPEVYLESSQKQVSHLCKSDQEVMQNEATQKSMMLHMREAFRSSAVEAVSELKLLGNLWGIDFSDINAPIEVWHGEADTLSPINGLKKFITRIPKCNTHFLKEKGHFLDEDDDLWRKILLSLKD
ncbi:MAG: alpha/beta hydrolase [Saprospiraceae bacterium]|nr:alpha/beta hydrolase [Saprospiraceae bacterium]